MTIFGLVWLLLLFVALMRDKRTLLVTLVLISSTLQSSNVLVVHGQGIGPQIITSGVVSLYLLLPKIKRMKFRTTKQIFVVHKTLAALFIYIVFTSVYSGTIGINILRIIQLYIYILCFGAMEYAGQTLDDKYVYCALKKISIFILIVGVVQVLATTNIIPRYWFIRDIFWNDSVGNPEVVQFMWPFGSYFRFFSTYMEPSYFVGFSIGAIFYFFNYRENRKKDMRLIVALAVSTILSFSSTGYGALLITTIIYVAFLKEKKVKLYILAGGILGFCILYFGFYNVLDTVIFSKMQGGSAAARTTWNLEAIKAFQSSPFFGVGYKNCRASSMFYTILAELGVIGFALYMAFILSIIWPVFTKYNQKRVGNEQVGLIFSIIAVTVTQMIAVPDFDICTFWMWMDFLGLIIGRNKQRIQLYGLSR